MLTLEIVPPAPRIAACVSVSGPPVPVINTDVMFGASVTRLVPAMVMSPAPGRFLVAEATVGVARSPATNETTVSHPAACILKILPLLADSVTRGLSFRSMYPATVASVGLVRGR